MRGTVTIPVLVLLGFAAWTLLILLISVGIYRWSLILTGRAALAAWRADMPQGADWYQRAMRAHMNCIENLPVYTALVLALNATGVQGPLIDLLCVATLAARVLQSTVHIALPLTNLVVGVRFSFYSVQFVCMVAIMRTMVFP
jgi:uncharacterized MAPEG superfamily protein